MPEEKFLLDALKLAKRGKGLVSPNPMVGALVVRGSQIVGRGWHRAYGLPHAEIEALRQAGSRAKGSTLYVTLEPCCHYGKTPPCVKAIVAAGIKEVVCCIKDPNPLVDGKGFRFLEEHGIKVRSGWLEKEAMSLNQPYLTRLKKNRPFLILKWAMSLDGKIATVSGDSRWLTSEETRAWAKKYRFTCDGILVGINTILKDNPRLNFEPPRFQTQQSLLVRKKYTKIVLDSRLRIPESANIFADKQSRVIIFTSEKAPLEKRCQLNRENCTVITVNQAGKYLQLKEVLSHLLSEEIGILLVEGGHQVLTSFWQERLVDKVMIFIGNKFIGGTKSLSPLGGPDRLNLEPAAYLKEFSAQTVNDNWLIQGEPCFPG
ncbi:MAG: bifunctional diaminohydroxyphosphoribosylaminopyrimidine deaminase/5-amino-6-(5-phosphoribosylamino)uracil reductase RibD [Candidatus Omnitrophica bacterium]|nr:bifunctional diaminohydroxyphosphoribosylaminopyrimidine deaminase/5-amino-6-(5-phosphoribosylamino)uracil reductase RibD [Candidatus Omnitrophota bacterium]